MDKILILREVLTNLRNSRPLQKDSFECYQRSVIYFENFIGRSADTTDLTFERCNAWICREESLRNKPSYVRNLRRDLLVVWRFAADCCLCDYPRTRLVRIPKVEDREPEAWPMDWIPRLIEAAKLLPGAYRVLGIKASVYAEAYLRTQLDLLCRPGDMRGLAWVAVNSDGLVKWRQSKTGKNVVKRLRPDTLIALNKLREFSDQFVFPRSKSANEMMVRKVFEIAGIKKPKGESLGHLRHTGSSAILEQTGNADLARASLGHSPNSRVFERHYRAVDASKIKASDWYVD